MAGLMRGNTEECRGVRAVLASLRLQETQKPAGGANRFIVFVGDGLLHGAGNAA